MASETPQPGGEEPNRPTAAAVFNRAEAWAAALLLVAVAIGGVIVAQDGSQEPGPTVVVRGDGVPAYRVTADVNHDSWERLTLVPGIGVKTAQAIVDDREANGPFATVDDLARVKGIGEKSLESWRPYLTARWPDGVATRTNAGESANANRDGAADNRPQTNTALDARGIDPELVASAASRGLNYPLDVNTIDAEVLDALIPGVGPSIAQRIVSVRDADGPYRSLAELSARVRGVSDRMAREWERYLVCGSDDTADN